MIRRLQPDDLNAALKLTQAEQWSHRLEDWQFHYRLGRGWAICDDGGVLVGTASWWSYGEHHGSVGLVLVDRSQQGKGIGRQLMDTIIDDAGSRSLQLIATQAGLKLYRQCGFREVGLIEQRQGILSASSLPAPAERITFRAASADDFEALAILDAAAFGAPRRELIRQVLAEGTGIVATLDGHLAGFAMKRQAGRGTLIGPVVADTESLAIALVAQTLTSTTGFTRIDIPAEASGLARWLDTVGLVRVDTVTAMLLGERPELHTGVLTFGLASQAFG
jgi:GNAT superfamily N-acetyltransferase